MLENISIFWYLIVNLALAEFAMQMQISELASWVKGKTGLIQPYKLSGLSSYSFWHMLVGKWFAVLSPLLLVIVGFFNIHRFLSRLVDCPWCTSFWFALAVNLFYFHMPIMDSFLLAPVALVFVTLLDKLHTW